MEWWIDGAMRSTERAFRYDFGRRDRAVPVEVRAWDTWGNGSVKTFPIVVDAKGPTALIASPGYDGALVRGSKITSTLITSDPSGIGWATLDGAASVHSAPYTSSIPAGRDGARTLTWYVLDTWGLLTTKKRTVIVDNTRPALKMTQAPAAGAKVPGTVKVSASATDRNGISRVELLVNGKVVGTDRTSAYGFSINSAKYGSTFSVALRAYDRAGNSVSTSARTWRR
jgi:hypothetical protein